MNTEKLKEYSELYLKHKQLKRELEEVAQQLEQQEAGLIEHLIEAGVDKVSLSNGRTLFIRRTVWPKYKDGCGRPEVIDALKQSGYEDLVDTNYNSQRFAALIRELDANGEELPPALAKVVEPSEGHKLIVKQF